MGGSTRQKGATVFFSLQQQENWRLHLYWSTWRVVIPRGYNRSIIVRIIIYTVDSRYSGFLKYGYLDILAIWFGMDC